MKAAIIVLICVGSVAGLIAPVLQINETVTPDVATAIVGVSVFLFWPLFYFLPAIAAHGRQHSGAIFLLNLLLGWTLVGWVAALVWAAAASPRRPAWQVASN